MSTIVTKRINVTFPVELLEKLGEELPSGERNAFIVKATEQAYRDMKFDAVLGYLSEHGPIWKDEDHPDMLTSEDIDRWVRNLREASMPRTWDEMLAEDEEEISDEDVSPKEERHDVPVLA
jgi:hypothetical protein